MSCVSHFLLSKIIKGHLWTTRNETHMTSIEIHPIDFVKEVTPPLWIIYFVALMSNARPFTNIMSTEFFSVFYSKISSRNSTYSVTNGSGTFWTSLPLGYLYGPVWGDNQYLWHSINTCWIEIKVTPTESYHCALCSKNFQLCVEKSRGVLTRVFPSCGGIGVNAVWGRGKGKGLLLNRWFQPGLWDFLGGGENSWVLP